MAMNEMIKSAVDPQWAKCEINDSGTATRRMLIQPERIKLRSDWTTLGASCGREWSWSE